MWILLLFSLSNAFYTVTRTRKYRLFQANVEVKPQTPSARRVKVDAGQSPVASSPLRYLANMVLTDTPESRAHPDKETDVWEISVWDPLPVSLRLFCLFGPGNVLVYMLFLPLAPLDPRPSVTVFNALILQIIISIPLLAFCTLFTQQSKDAAIIQKEVMHEYDTKFVHPRLHPVVRDVGTQFSDDDAQPKSLQKFVQTGTPTVQIRHTFQTHTNPYTRSTETPRERDTTPNNIMKPQMFTPPTAARRSDMFTPSTSQKSISLRKSLPAGYVPATTSTASATSTGTNQNFGGNMGVHSHRHSPLKKATSMNDISARPTASPRNSREMAAYEQRNWRQGTPSKNDESRRLTGSGGTNNPFANMARRKAEEERPPGRAYF